MLQSRQHLSNICIASVNQCALTMSMYSSKLYPENTSLLEENSYCSFWTIVICLCDAFIVKFYSILSFWQYITRI